MDHFPDLSGVLIDSVERPSIACRNSDGISRSTSNGSREPRASRRLARYASTCVTGSGPWVTAWVILFSEFASSGNSGFAGVRLLQLGDVKLFHWQHRFHRPLCASGFFILEKLAHVRGNDLPREAVLVL